MQRLHLWGDSANHHITPCSSNESKLDIWVFLYDSVCTILPLCISLCPNKGENIILHIFLNLFQGLSGTLQTCWRLENYAKRFIKFWTLASFWGWCLIRPQELSNHSRLGFLRRGSCFMLWNMGEKILGVTFVEERRWNKRYTEILTKLTCITLYWESLRTTEK